MCGAGYELYFRPFDCADMKQIDKNFSEILNEKCYPDIFINCSYPRTEDWGDGSFKDITLESFRKNVDIQMNSYAWLARLAAEAMAKKGNGGSIIQLGSIYGILGQDLTVYEGTDMHENMTYAAIKGGITSLTRQMASYYGQFNIRVNTLVPGGLLGHVAGKSDSQNPVFVKQYSHKTPLKRLGRADEVASTALFLASDASSYITGATIMVDGGWTAV
jgi:NAD(P)-dependent dehydrogenase (short-subunit alcohol dehydrogenase family)